MMMRMTTICLTAAFLVGLNSSSVQGQDPHAQNLKGITAVAVVVEDLPDGAKVLGLTKDTIRTDVELKLRLAGMRVVTQGEGIVLPGSPSVYVQVTVTNPALAANIDLELNQDVLLQRNGQLAPFAVTWRTNSVLANPTLQSIRNDIKDCVDQFLNDWLSVNPKK